jgi:hypothetical protein
MEDSGNNNSFINHLLEETYQSLPEEDSARAAEDLYSYFREKRSQSLKQNPLAYFKECDIPFFSLIFNQLTSCYRLHVAGLDLDIPSNWEFFNSLHNTLQNNGTDYLPLWENEHAHFAETLDAFFSADPGTQQAFIVHNSTISLVLITPENNELLKYLEGFSSLEAEALAA